MKTTLSFLRDVRANVQSGIRLALFLPLRIGGLTVSWSQLIALFALNLLVTFLVEFAAIGPSGQFAWYSLPGAVFYVPLILVAAWSLALLARQSDLTLMLMVALSALAVPIDLIDALYKTLLQHWSPRWLARADYAIYYLPALWLTLAATVAAVRVLGLSGVLRAPALVLVALVLVLPQVFIWRMPLWAKSYDEEAGASARSRYMALAGEDAFYLQPKLLERELAALRPGRKGAVDLYFVGMAGYANQDVFMKEVNSVEKLVRERFDAEGHTVRLINNPKTVADTPIASVTSLRATLKRVAEVMDRDEDVLLLFLTSHGSRDHHFSLDFWPMSFNTLDPATLRQLLDESGIKRRVVIVSACYSGGFIKPLEDANTLVISASAADRNSFGCGNENDFTYFGKAYFDEALRETYSFVEAFEKAKPRIAEREKKDDFKGSDPQMSVGENIKPVLATLENRLKSGTVVASSSPAPARRPGAEVKYARFVDIWMRAEVIGLLREECLANMAKSSPAYYLKKDRNTYGGLDENSPHWPRLMTAWAAYSEDYCSATIDPKLYRGIYIDSWGRNIGERDLDAAMNFLRSEPGQHFNDAEGRVSVDATRRVLESSRPSTDAATKRFQDAFARINADFQRDRQRPEGQRTKATVGDAATD